MTNPTFPISQVRLGKDGPLVGAQGLGCMGMSEFYGQTDDAEARATLDRALELGVTLFDTADMYGLGDNERFLGEALRHARGRAFIATKFGYVRTPENPNDWGLSNRPEFIRQAVDNSLQRLGAEVIDLYYMHRRDQETPLAESVGAMAELVKAGKVRTLGLSEVSADELREAHAIHPIAALQSEWSLFSRDIEAEVAPLAAELGVAIVPFAPLGRGLLTASNFTAALSSDDARHHFPRFATETADRNAQLVKTVEAIAAEIGVTPAQVALGWLHGQAHRLGVTAIPIPGTRRRTRLEENVAALNVRLSDDDMDRLGRLAADVVGVRV
ncbi:aldo/keto reductase [Brevundimonas sp. GCM10030266]|uniref:aldo/keto reductase n=1 Tax=Brevundimonas sp. GCM10030266 TaxID=3273386 RepID=UPI003622BF9A